MKTESNPAPARSKRRVGKRFVVGAVVVAVVAIAGWRHFAAGSASETMELPMFTVVSGPLDITVTAAGTVQSRHSEVVKSQARGRNTVVWVIEEGKIVTNGQLLVELDSTEMEKSRDQQEITVGNSEAAWTQAKEKLEIARIDKESKLSEAELKVKLAKLSFDKYVSGEYPQQLQDAQSKIAMANEELERANEALGWTKKLAAEGFITRSELQADELSVRQKKISLEAAVTSLNLLTNFSAREQHAKLSSDVKQAERALDRAIRETRSNIAQAESEVAAKEQEKVRQLDRLNTMKKQVESCRIVAPTNGLVIYASTMQASRRRWSSEPLAPGSTVYQSQDLMSIPVSGEMLVQFSVPESELPKLKQGLTAVITADALPDFSIKGQLTKIGLLPDGENAWLNPEMNVYNCEIMVDTHSTTNGALLRAGMKCDISMLIESHADVLSVPMQCVLRVGDEPVVFKLENGAPVPYPVKLGYDNGRMIHILGGISAGDEIMLTPPLDAAEVEEEAAGEEDGAAAAPSGNPEP